MFYAVIVLRTRFASASVTYVRRFYSLVLSVANASKPLDGLRNFPLSFRVFSVFVDSCQVLDVFDFLSVGGLIK